MIQEARTGDGLIHNVVHAIACNVIAGKPWPGTTCDPGDLLGDRVRRVALLMKKLAGSLIAPVVVIRIESAVALPTLIAKDFVYREQKVWKALNRIPRIERPQGLEQLPGKKGTVV